VFGISKLAATCQIAQRGIFGPFDIDLEQVDVRSDEIRQAPQLNGDTWSVVALPQRTHSEA
jgi:hypothetical protein